MIKKQIELLKKYRPKSVICKKKKKLFVLSAQSSER